MKRVINKIIISVMILMLLSSCNMPSPEQQPGDPSPDLNLILTQIAEDYAETAVNSVTEETETEEPTPEPTPEPTAVPEKTETLTVCLGKEPATLFFYDESSQAMWSVLEAIYDGPFDVGNGQTVPVIFDEILTESVPVTVIRGDIIVDINGNAAELRPGTVFMPAEPAEGCTGSGCLVTWNSMMQETEIMQTVITFRLKEDLIWSDGTPLTAADSVFSMNLNGMRGINASKRSYNLTESYTAPDDHTVVWRGLPGYEPGDPSEVFWTPLPAHQMNGMSVEAIRASETINRTPLGWGAWRIASWEQGSEIVAERNPYYLSADGAEPFFDRIVYKFYGAPGDNNLEALSSGKCDIIDSSVDLLPELEQILEDVRDGYEAVYIRPELTRQELVLNFDPVRPAAQDLLADPVVRTAIMQCIDREAVGRSILMGQSEVPADFYPADHALHDPELSALAYDPEAAGAALEEAGWKMPENGSVRTAAGARGIYYGTELAFTLYTSESALPQKAGEMIRADLARCGIGITLEPLPLGELYAQGPDGVIFGRSFDMALFSWSASSDPCAVYRSDRIPENTNHWVGTNVGGYRNEEYDEACLLPGWGTSEAGKIFAGDIPAVPLYFNLSIAVSGSSICGITDQIGSRSILWNIERLSRSEDRCAVSQWNNIYQQ